MVYPFEIVVQSTERAQFHPKTTGILIRYHLHANENHLGLFEVEGRLPAEVRIENTISLISSYACVRRSTSFDPETVLLAGTLNRYHMHTNPILLVLFEAFVHDVD